MKDFFTFRKFIAPVLIQIIYWVITAAAVIGGLVMIINGVSYRYSFWSEGISGILILILAPLAARLWAEYMMGFFEMRRNLRDVRDILLREAYEREELKHNHPQP
ncbi:MAG: DUF4282 domain-containing protein [Anaerolineaceae bacterium]|nr:DUF4282 domain-containing protein [Anaerolineaceae bacterium]